MGKKDDNAVDLITLVETSSSLGAEIKVELVDGAIKIPNIQYADKTHPSGRWLSAFPPPSLEQQEEYILKMIERDKEKN